MEHEQCISDWACEVLAEYEWLPPSRFSVFAATDQLVAKIRRPQTVVTDIDADWAVRLAEAEVTRGRACAPSVYIRNEPIRCRNRQVGHCTAAVLMQRMPFASRLDRIFQTATEHECRELTERLFRSQRAIIQSLPRADCATLASLDSSDLRLMEVVRRRAPMECGLISLWGKLLEAREHVRGEICDRDDRGNSRVTHGDLAADNIYVHEDAIIVLDPSVAFPDLYKLDYANDWAHLGVSVAELQPALDPLLLVARCSEEASTSDALMRHYFGRVALIRTTLRTLEPLYGDQGNRNLTTLAQIGIPE